MTLTAVTGAELGSDARLRVAAIHARVYQLDLLGIDSHEQALLTNEAWLLCHGLDPQDFPDDTMTQVSTRSLVRTLASAENREELLAFMVCTLKHIS